MHIERTTTAGPRHGTSRRPRARSVHLDGPIVVYVALLLLLPSTMVYGPLGASGTPANVLGVGLLWVWAAGRLHPALGMARDRQPVRTVVLAFGAAAAHSVVAAAFRPIVPIEVTSLDRGVLMLLGCAGVGLIVADGIEDRAQLDRIVRWLVGATTLVAIAGIVQFTFGFDVKSLLRLPGLTENLRVDGIAERSTFRRVSGTASHAVEFAVILALVFPLAVHRAVFGAVGAPLRRWGPLVAIGLALPMSLSRSGFVALAVALAVLLPTWPRERRRRSLVAGSIFLVCTRFAIPGLIGTIKSLFINLGNDPSIDGRTEDYAVFGRYFADHALFGRGFFTFLPDRYTTFDNQFMLSLVEVGIVGTVALVMLFLIGMGTARGARQRAVDEETRHLGQVLAASLAGALVAFGTFDALSFPMVAGCVFLILGLSGALWRLTPSPTT